MLPALFEVLLGLVTSRQLSHINAILCAIFATTGAVSMLSISRVSGIAYRTIQRFYAQFHDWNAIRFRLYERFVPSPTESEGEITLTLDEVVEDKCGTKTFGMDWFYGGLYSKVVKGVSVLQISAVHTDTKNSYPLSAIQLQKNEVDKQRNLERKAKKIDLEKRKLAAKNAGIAFVGKVRGRKKGSKNKDKSLQCPVDKHDSILFRHCKILLTPLMILFQNYQGSKPRFLVGDGSFGNQYYIALVAHYKLHLISKLKRTAKIHLPFTGKRAKGQRGPNKKYGELLFT